MEDKLKKKTLQLKVLRIEKKRDRDRLLSLKELQKKQNKILEQIKERSEENN